MYMYVMPNIFGIEFCSLHPGNYTVCQIWHKMNLVFKKKLGFRCTVFSFLDWRTNIEKGYWRKSLVDSTMGGNAL